NPINRSFFMTATNLYVLRIFRPTVLRSLKIRVFMRIYSWQRKYGQKEGMRLLILFIDYWNANWLRASDLKPMRLSSSYTTALSICGSRSSTVKRKGGWLDWWRASAGITKPKLLRTAI